MVEDLNLLGEKGLMAWKRDYDVPIKYFEENYVKYFLERTQGYNVEWYNGLVSLIAELKEHLNTEDGTVNTFLDKRAEDIKKVTDVIKYIKGYNVLEIIDIKVHEDKIKEFMGFHKGLKTNIYTQENHDKKFISINLADQGFQVLRKIGLDTGNCRTLSELIKDITKSDYLSQSSFVKNKILSYCYPEKIAVLTKYFAIQLAEDLEKEGYKLYGMVGNTLIIETMNYEPYLEKELDNIYTVARLAGLRVELEVFEIEFICKDFIVKHYNKGRKAIELKKVIGAKFLQALAFVQNKELEAQDMYFVVDDELVRYVRPSFEGIKRDSKWI